jgi:hypothetical protein
MRYLGMEQRSLVPFFLVLLAAPACGGDDDDDRGGDSPGGGGVQVDAAQPDARAAESCAGQPVACEDSIGPFTCEAQMGCTADSECRPNPFFNCGGLDTESECQSVGCDWLSECTGGGLCFVETNELDCLLEPGCFWESFCDPLSTPDTASCGGIADEKSCADGIVCEWEYVGCSGTPSPCPTLDEESCATQAGCNWQL